MPDDEQTLLKEATALLKQKKYDDAAHRFHALGSLFLKEQNYSKALASFLKSLEFFRHPDVFISLASVYEALHYPYSAYECLEHALLDAYQQKAFDQMMDLCLNMIRLDHTQYTPHEKLAEYHVFMDDAVQAAQEFQKASKIAFQQKSFKKAVELLYFAFKLTPKNIEIWRDFKKILIHLDPSNPNADKIERELQKNHFHFLTPAKTPEEVGQILNDAGILMEENLLDDAKDKVQSVLADNPNQLEAQKALKKIARLQHEGTHTRIPLPPKDLIRSLNEDLGLGLVQERQTSSIVCKTLASELSPFSYYDLAIGYKEMNLYDDALGALEKALQKSPAHNTEIGFQLNCTLLVAQCFVAQKKWFEAISFLEKSLYQNLLSFDKLPKEYRLAMQYELSSAYEESGDDEKALSCLRSIERESRSYRDIIDKINVIRIRLHSRS